MVNNWSVDDDFAKKAQAIKQQEEQKLDNGLGDFFKNKQSHQQPTSSEKPNAFSSVPVNNPSWGSSFETTNNGVSNVQQPVENPQNQAHQPQQENQNGDQFFDYQGATIKSIKATVDISRKGVAGFHAFSKEFFPYIGDMFGDLAKTNFFLTRMLTYSGLYLLGSVVLSLAVSTSFLPYLYVSGLGFCLTTTTYITLAMFKGSDFLQVDVPEKGDFDLASDSSDSSYKSEQASQSVSDDSVGFDSAWQDVKSSPAPSVTNEPAPSYDFDDEEEEPEPEFYEFEDDDFDDFDEAGLDTTSKSTTTEDWANVFKSHSSASSVSDSDMSNPNLALASLEGADDLGLSPELVTRRALLDKFLDSLDSSSVGADSARTVEVDSIEGREIINFINMAVEGIKGNSSDDWLKAKSIIERVTCYVIMTNRTDKFKNSQEAKLESELSSLLQYSMSEKFGKNVYATVRGFGSTLEIKIYKSETPKVYLKNLIEKERAFFENPKNVLPVAYGFDTDGNVILDDMSKHPSIVVSGLAGGGKSNLTSVMVDTMIALNPPSVVNFVIGDMKELNRSVWYTMNQPHIKRFESGTRNIVDLLHWVSEVERQRRIDLLASVGANKIQSYNSMKPDEPMPYLFLILDEVAMFSETATSEELADYRSILVDLITSSRDLGIYIMVIAHQLHDQIIPKRITRQVENKFAVQAGTDIQETVWSKIGSKALKLDQRGEFAYTIGGSDKPLYGKAPLLMDDTNSKRTEQLFESQRKMWTKLAVDSVADSVYTKRHGEALYNNSVSKGSMLDEINRSIEDDLDTYWE